MATKRTKMSAATLGTVLFKILQDEDLRSHVMGAGAAFADKAKSWKGKRPAKDPENTTDKPPRIATPSALTKHGRLTKRVAAVSEAIEAIQRAKPDGSGLDRAPEAIAELRTALTVAERLPREQSAAIYDKVSAHLADLEAAVAEAVLQTGP